MTTAAASSGSDDFSISQPPRHVAIIMDGNGRWATARNLPRGLGHRQGIDTMRAVTRGAGELGIQYLTLYSFSAENWGRPAEEVSDLMGLLRQFVKRDLAELIKNGVVVRVVGARNNLAPDILALVEEAENRTRHNNKLRLQIAFNYGGRDEILAAAKALAREVAAGTCAVEDIDKNLFAQYLQTSGIPDPDLVIRTSGEQRLSNFLIWQSAYAEFVVVDTLWPDFSKAHLIEAIAEFHRRERRFGIRKIVAEKAS